MPSQSITSTLWPLPAGTAPELSPKDTQLPGLAEFDSPFPYDGRPLGLLA